VNKRKYKIDREYNKCNIMKQEQNIVGGEEWEMRQENAYNLFDKDERKGR
jgi:hypothetical protein